MIFAWSRFLAVWGKIISAFLLLLTALRWGTNQKHSYKAQQVTSSSTTEVGSSTWCGWVCRNKGPIDEGLILEGSITKFPELKVQAHGICTKFLLMLKAFVPFNIEIWHFNSFFKHNLESFGVVSLQIRVWLSLTTNLISHWINLWMTNFNVSQHP